MFFPPISFDSKHHLIESGEPRQTAADRGGPVRHSFLGVHFFQKIRGPMTPCLPKQLAAHR